MEVFSALILKENERGTERGKRGMRERKKSENEWREDPFLLAGHIRVGKRERKRENFVWCIIKVAKHTGPTGMVQICTII